MEREVACGIRDPLIYEESTEKVQNKQFPTKKNTAIPKLKYKSVMWKQNYFLFPRETLIIKVKKKEKERKEKTSIQLQVTDTGSQRRVLFL